MHGKFSGAALFAVCGLLASAVAFADAPRTMRVDYIHSGNALDETYALDRVVIEPLPWPGNPARPIDDSNRGVNLFEVVDPKSGEVLYSRGFSTIFGEWRTTEEAQKMSRAFQESLRFPTPDVPVRVRVLTRDERNLFSVVWSVDLDPDAMEIVRTAPPAPTQPIAIRRYRTVGAESGSADPGRRLHGGGEEQVRGGRTTTERRAVQGGAVQRAGERFQCLGVDRADAGIGRVASLDKLASRVRAVDALRHLRQRALRPDARQPCFSRPRAVRAVRIRRDPGQQRDLWRRRHLRSVQYGRCGQRVGELSVRSRIRSSLRGARR